MTMNSPVASRTRQKQTVQRSQSEASGRYSASGGGRWLNKLMALCHGTTLAVGDLRCLLGQIFTVSQMRAFEEDAGMSNTQNNLPYTAVCTSVGSTLRKQFPTPPTTYQNIKFRIKPDQQ